MITDLQTMISAHGDRGMVVPFSRVADIKADMQALKDGDYHPSWLDRMTNYMTGDRDRFLSPEITFTPRSLISIIRPSPAALLQFTYNGKLIDCMVPPYFSDWDAKNKQVLQYLRAYLMPLGFSAEIAVTFPQKLLAVHCGLAKYGRNNICYSEEFSSHISIMTYVSDFPCEETTWFPLSRMEQCDRCHACVDACPTSAIDIDRRLINSDRCIAFANELIGDFPEWLDESVHNSLIGCVKCQDCCPANAHNTNIIKGVAFTEEETLALLHHAEGAPYAGSLAAKLEATGISPEYTRVFPRNLAALLQKEGRL